MTQLRCTSVTGKALKPTRASAALEAAYYRDLMRIIREMNDSVTYWLTANYRKHENAIAQDSTANNLQRLMDKMLGRWRKQFDEVSRHLAKKQAKRWQKHGDTSLMAHLKEVGFSVRFRPTKAITNTINGIVNQNATLIKSIGDQHMTEVSEMVQRSVMAGRDLASLTKELRERFGITKRRAAFIARDQNNKATSFITRTRQIDLGLTEAIWCHSSAGKHPRPTHVKAGRERLRYDIRKGADVDGNGKLIFPGEEINCRCTSQVIIPGFDT